MIDSSARKYIRFFGAVGLFGTLGIFKFVDMLISPTDHGLAHFLVSMPLAWAYLLFVFHMVGVTAQDHATAQLAIEAQTKGCAK